jgi:hypothetical protein
MTMPAPASIPLAKNTVHVLNNCSIVFDGASSKPIHSKTKISGTKLVVLPLRLRTENSQNLPIQIESCELRSLTRQVIEELTTIHGARKVFVGALRILRTTPSSMATQLPKSKSGFGRPMRRLKLASITGETLSSLLNRRSSLLRVTVVRWRKTAVAVGGVWV